MNKIIISSEKKGCHLEKDSLFDILSLVNQLH